MSKKTEIKSTIDLDLESLYASATDFPERAKAMELRIAYEKLKKGAVNVPSFFGDGKDIE